MGTGRDISMFALTRGQTWWNRKVCFCVFYFGVCVISLHRLPIDVAKDALEILFNQVFKAQIVRTLNLGTEMSPKDMKTFRLSALSKKEKKAVIDSLVASCNSPTVQLKDDKGNVVKYDPDNMVIRAGMHGKLWNVVYDKETETGEFRWGCASLRKVCANAKMMKDVRNDLGIE